MKFNSEQAQQRLEHLKSLPETPSRAREIEALRRALQTYARHGSGSGSRRRASVKKETGETYESPKKPQREIERLENGHRRMKIRPKHPEEEHGDDNDRDEKEMERIRSDYRRLLGHGFSGMS